MPLWPSQESTCIQMQRQSLRCNVALSADLTWLNEPPFSCPHASRRWCFMHTLDEAINGEKGKRIHVSERRCEDQRPGRP